MATQTHNLGGGPGHAIITEQIIANESLMRLIGNLLIPRLVGKHFQNYFAQKIGNTISIKRPAQMKATKGRTLSLQPMIDDYVDITVNIDGNFGIKMDADSKTLDITAFGDRYLQVGAEELAYLYDEAGGQEFHEGMVFMDGTPGSEMNIEGVKKMVAHWSELEMPVTSTMRGLVRPLDLVSIDTEIKDLHADAPVHDIIRKTYMGMYSGFELFQSNHVPPFEVHDYGTATPVVEFDASTGATQEDLDNDATTATTLDTTYEGNKLPTDGWGSTNRKILNKGQLITIADIYEIQPRGNRHSIGRLKTFLVTDDVRCSGGTAVIPIYPEINSGTSTTLDENGNSVSRAAYQTCTKAAVNNAAIIVVGTKGKSYRQSMFFHPTFMEYVNIQMEQSDAFTVSKMSYDKQTGLSLLVTKGGEVRDLTEIVRVDILGAVKAVRPEVGIRYITGEVGNFTSHI